MEHASPSSQLVVIGSSAGGVGALGDLLAGLPTEFPVPVVIAQHLDPTRPSHLQEILARRTSLRVRTIMDQESLEPGTVYVVPADRDVTINDHVVRVRSDMEPRPKPSVDLLFGTAAAEYGERLYAVILTGTGSDGADGARLVKEAGGTVIIQNPETASFPGMPLSLAPTTVDIVADLNAIGALLYALVTGAYEPPTPEEDRRMRALLEQLRARSGIDFSAYRQPTIQRRLRRRMADTGRDSLDDYIRYLQAHPEEYQRLASAFLINVTDFFRDADVFEYLRAHTIPDLVQDARNGTHAVRAWSAGCATGEEAYSLALLIAEALGNEIDNFDVRIFATDLDADAIAFARRGIYPASALKAVPSELVIRYFTQIDGAFEAKKIIRRLIVFAQHDLGQRAPFPQIDLVLCRNVLIYFTPELQRRALQLFAFSLRTGGRLVVGKSETTSPLPEYFTLEEPRLKIFRRQGGRIMPTATEASGAFGGARERRRVDLSHSELGLTRAAQNRSQVHRASEQAERLLLELPVGVVVVNRQYHISAINPAARRLLQVFGVVVGEDFVHATRQLPVDRLREAIDHAFLGHAATAQFDLPVPGDPGGGAARLEISFFPDQIERSSEPDERVTIIIRDVTTAVERQNEVDAWRAAERESIDRLDAEFDRLTESMPGAATDSVARARELWEATRARIELQAKQLVERMRERGELMSANQVLATDNARLRGRNEELEVMSEELQAAVEEIETLSEEQQASHEELETLNEELQATVEELKTTNEELVIQRSELEESGALLEGERARIEAVLATMAEGVLVIDRSSGDVLLTNRAFQQLFGQLGSTFIPLDESGRPLREAATPQARARRGESFVMEFGASGADARGRFFEATAEPIYLAGSEASLLVIRDITDRSLLHLQSDFLTMASHEIRSPITVIRSVLEALSLVPAMPGEDPRQRQLLRQGVLQVHLLSDLVARLTDAVRIQEGELPLDRRRVDLVEIVRSAIEVGEARDAKPPIQLDAPAGRLWVLADELRLQEVFLNLLNNAAEYAAQSPSIDVRVSAVGGEARVDVRDYGPGISVEDRQQIFTRFYRGTESQTAGHRGLGLGLYIANYIATAHGGRIDVQPAADGKGALFTVHIPLSVT